MMPSRPIPASPEPGQLTEVDLDILGLPTTRKQSTLSSAKNFLAIARSDQMLQIARKQIYVTCSAGSPQQLYQF